MPTTSARLDPIHRTTAEPTAENAVKDVYSTPSEIDPRFSSCESSDTDDAAAGEGKRLVGLGQRAGDTYRVDGALEVLRGVVGEEDEEESGAQHVHVTGGRRGRAAGAGAGDQGCGGLLDVAGGRGELCFGWGHGGVGDRRANFLGEEVRVEVCRRASRRRARVRDCDLGNGRSGGRRTAGRGLKFIF